MNIQRTYLKATQRGLERVLDFMTSVTVKVDGQRDGETHERVKEL